MLLDEKEGEVIYWEVQFSERRCRWTHSAVGEHVLRSEVWKTSCLAVAAERHLS